MLASARMVRSISAAVLGRQIVTLEDELSERLGVKVDLVPRRGLRSGIRARILAEAVPVWPG